MIPLQLLSKDAQDWLKTASHTDIANAVEYGWRAADALDKSRAPMKNPNKKGSDGELKVYDALRNTYVAKTGLTDHAGDILIEADRCRILVEVKNYSSPVPTAEIEKFHRDVDSNAVNCGLFVSLGSPIQAVTKTFHSAERRTGVRCIYLVSDDANTILAAVDMLIYGNKMNEEAQLAISASCDEALAARDFTRQLDTLLRTKGELLAASSTITASLARISADIATTERALREAISVISKTETTKLLSCLQAHCSRYSPIMRDMVAQVADTIETTYPNGKWKVNSRRAQHTICGHSFEFGARAVSVCVPVTAVEASKLVALIGRTSKQLSISNEVKVELEGSSIELICGLVRNEI